jgi:glutamine amidotransferase
VVDHGAGNLVSVAQGLVRSGAEVEIADGPGGMAGADAVVLPGVGATGAAMSRLVETGLDQAIREWQGPLLGICVGVQLFFGLSEEDGGTCLELMPGSVVRLQDTPRLPHIGWNELHDRADDPIFDGLEPGATFYFVHSYAPVPDDDAVVIARSEYGRPFVAAVRDGHRVGVQFHPERSGRQGLHILSNFVRHVAPVG